MQHSARLGWVDAARKTHLGSSDLPSNAGNHKQNTAIQLCPSVNSFLQARGSEPLQLHASIPGWKGLNLGLIPKCDSSQIADLVLQTPKKAAWITGAPNHGESWISRDGKASHSQTENKQKSHLRQGADWAQEEFLNLLHLWNGHRRTNPSSLWKSHSPKLSRCLGVAPWEPTLRFPRKIKPRERH